MSMRLSRRFETARQSPIRSMTIECNKVGGVNLAQGICDLSPPPGLFDAARQAMEDGFNIYTRMDGLDSLRRVIADKLAEQGIEADPETEIVVTIGSTGAFCCAALAMLDPGDEVILFEPYYGYHRAGLENAGAVPRYVRLDPPDWAVDLSRVEAAITERTRAMVVCTPANPTGKVFSAAELEALADLARRRDLLIFTDEIYEYFLYDGREHVPPARLPGMRERTITLSGFSKTFSITGWRIGYLFGDARWIRALAVANDTGYVCAPAPLQEAVARTWKNLPKGFLGGIRTAYQKKRDQLCGALAASGLTPHVPQGAYYVLADVSWLPGATSQERVMHLLRETGVAAVPGTAFFHDPADGEGLARFCFAKADADLDRACQGLAKLKR